MKIIQILKVWTNQLHIKQVYQSFIQSINLEIKYILMRAKKPCYLAKVDKVHQTSMNYVYYLRSITTKISLKSLPNKWKEEGLYRHPNTKQRPRLIYDQWPGLTKKTLIRICYNHLLTNQWENRNHWKSFNIFHLLSQVHWI